MADLETLPENPITIDDLELLAREYESLKKGVLDFVARLRARSNVDQRWLAIGTPDFEKGMMGIGHAYTKAPMAEIHEKLQALKG